MACFLIYSIICFAGYLNFMGETEFWITHNYFGPVFFVGKVGISLALFFAVPMNILACRNIIHDMLLSDEMEY